MLDHKKQMFLPVTESHEAYMIWSADHIIPQAPILKVPIKAASCGKEHVLLLSNIGGVFSVGGGRYKIHDTS